MSNLTFKSGEQLLCRLYLAMNERNLASVIATLEESVEWSDMTNGESIIGRECVRNYWNALWLDTRVETEPLLIEKEEDGRYCVEAHQRVTDLRGQAVSDEIVYHVYRVGKCGVLNMKIRQAAT
jgi:hypothetical protein